MAYRLRGNHRIRRAGRQRATLAVLQALVANEGDGWTLMLEELERYYENSARVATPEELERTMPAT